MASTLYGPIMDALLALLQTKCGTIFKTYSRRMVMWEELAQNMSDSGTSHLIRQPALYLFDGVITGESGLVRYERTGRGVPFKREMQRAIVLYAQLAGGGTPAGIDATTPGGDVFYPLIEAVEDALEPDPNQYGVQTLDGRAFQCWLEGTSYIFTGDIDPYGQGMAIMPVKIMIP